MTNMSHSSTLLVPRNSPDEFQLQFEREFGLNPFAKQDKGIYIYMDIIWSLYVPSKSTAILKIEFILDDDKPLL